MIHRRDFLQSALCAGLAAGSITSSLLPLWARAGTANNMSGMVLKGHEFNLDVSARHFEIDGQTSHAILVNNQLPAPLLRWREGDEVTLNVTNHLAVDTSIHWHGILLPYQMDGVPGVSFAGIKPGQTFTYRFPLLQAGTYWYHSHSGLQEQQGHYGPIIIEPKNPDPVQFDREYVLVLSDWTFLHPHKIFSKLKKMSDVYNRQQRTVVDFWRDVETHGFNSAFAQRAMWGAMRMNPTDIADVSGAVYTYLINGHSSQANWQALFSPGERVRLRVINASAMTIFNFRIPGLPMQVVQADGLDVQPVDTDEFQIGVAETFDVVVQPGDQAYAVVAESNDRSGLVNATLTPRLGLKAAPPALRKRPLLTMKDMAHHPGSHKTGNHGMQENAQEDKHAHHQHHANHPPKVTRPQQHNHKKGPGVVGLAVNPVNRLGERPLGLENEPHRVLVYSQLKSLQQNPDLRAPQREMELHLTSNMERYMWSFDGVKFSDTKSPIQFNKGERLRLTMVNDTMMPHPIHLHGMFFDLVIPGGPKHEVDSHKPRKHTIVVKPGEKMSIDITADAPGDWAFHCHLLYHMHAGMMRVVSVA